jgi:hypothetical protein
MKEDVDAKIREDLLRLANDKGVKYTAAFLLVGINVGLGLEIRSADITQFDYHMELHTWLAGIEAECENCIEGHQEEFDNEPD